MLLSAEVRWFWEGQRADLHQWFRAAPTAPGGGGERIDTYLADPAQPELGIKVRGGSSEVEVKALVSEPAVERLGALSGTVQIWTKLSTTSLRLTGLPTIAVRKRRRLRRFDLTGAPIRELVLGQDEQPISGEPWPARGCSVELTEVWLDQGVWTTLCFEAFGSLGRIEASLSAAIRHYQSNPPPDGSGLNVSYPQWLAMNHRRR